MKLILIMYFSQRATVSLVNDHIGDALVLNSSAAAAFGITIESDDNHQILVRLSCVGARKLCNFFAETVWKR